MKRKVSLYILIISILLNIVLGVTLYFNHAQKEEQKADLSRMYIKALDRYVVPNLNSMVNYIQTDEYEKVIFESQNVVDNTLILINLLDTNEKIIPENLEMFVSEIHQICNDITNKIRTEEIEDINVKELEVYNKRLSGIVQEIKFKNILNYSYEELLDKIEAVTKANLVDMAQTSK
ncbi:hypothetical protein [Sporosalibacterium faouarense]|uniref:hypothetical protein n=1 Tax=Sporosalibacterium faouarense TaxID=516123 RepID=UPI00192CAFBF|nr:hypothetical protein [Sporosalibacterium faouarense]